MTSTGATDGFFQGVLDEARIWNYVWTESEDHDHHQPAGYLRYRFGRALVWGMGEGTDNFVVGDFNGTLTNGPSWVARAPLRNLNFVLNVTNPGTQSDDEGHTISLPIQASDVNPGDTLSYAATGLPLGLNIGDKSGSIAGTISYYAAANSPRAT